MLFLLLYVDFVIFAVIFSRIDRFYIHLQYEIGYTLNGVFREIQSILLPICVCLFNLGSKCNTQVDLGFLIDGSGSINKYEPANFKRCLKFVKKIIGAFVISPTASRVGAIVFSYHSKLQFGFSQFKTNQEVEEAVDRIEYPNHSTYAGKGLKMAAEKLFNEPINGVPRVLIVITDGRSRDGLIQPSEELKRSGVIIISVGIGKRYDKAQLNVMASNPKEKHVFTAEFSQMSNVVNALQQSSCEGRLWKYSESSDDKTKCSRHIPVSCKRF